MLPKETAIQRENRLIYTVAKLVESLAIDAAMGIATFDHKLAGRAGMLVRTTVENVRARFMDGRLNVANATIEQIEDSISLAVAAATDRLIGQSTGKATAPRDADTPPSA